MSIPELELEEQVQVDATKASDPDPVHRSQNISFSDMMEEALKRNRQLDQEKKDVEDRLRKALEFGKDIDEKIKAGLSGLQTQADAAKKELAEAKAKQEELEKELGVRKKTQEEKAENRAGIISDRMELAFKTAIELWEREVKSWKIDCGEDKQLHKWMTVFVGSTRSGASVLKREEPKKPGWCAPENDADKAAFRGLALKIYDELKAAEEAEKPKLTDEELRSLVLRVSKIAIVQGNPNQVDAAFSSWILQHLDK